MGWLEIGDREIFILKTGVTAYWDFDVHDDIEISDSLHLWKKITPPGTDAYDLKLINK